MSSLQKYVPLLIAAAILLAGNGLQGTLIGLRGRHEDFSTTIIGLMGTSYFAGFLLGCVVIPSMLRAVGHIRVFAALAAIAAAGTLTLVLLIDQYVWLVTRFFMGLCFSGLFTTIESWLNSGVSNENRGRVMSLYRLIDLGVVTGAQYLIPLFGVTEFTIFAVMALMFILSLVPVSLGDRSRPAPPNEMRLELGTVWGISPLACLGCVSIGLTNSAFRLMGPIYASDIGLNETDVASFISAGILGGAVLQYPFGHLSDRYDRRFVLMLATMGAVVSAACISLFAGTSSVANFIGIFTFGAFSLPLYSLSAAHANDFAKPGQYVQVAAGLTFFFSLGAVVGPTLSSLVMTQFGPQSLFAYTSIIHALLVLVVLTRMRARPTVPAQDRSRFRPLLRTSPFMHKLARQSENKDSQDKKAH